MGEASVRVRPVCSVLIPTRGRPQVLLATIDSFLRTATEPERIEVILRVHDDDEETRSLLSRKLLNHVRVVIGDSEDGYGSTDKFINCLAAVANGDWLFPAADEFTMLTSGWDNLIRMRLSEPRREPWLLTAKVVQWPQSRIAIMSRGLYHALGHMGRTGYADCYIDSLTHFAGIQEPVGIELSEGGLPPPVPRDRLKDWAVYRSEETAWQFNVDKLKLGAVLKRPIREKWTPLNAPEQP